ncbi:hypothetical protein [Halostagnicola kamekurae]|uniref:Uncharacterized protein n=1 Tax=Halostagnicola kamekurae TaxID=619731 RepID=A0A1I6V7P0_9EURY|nr:hypothetical protein [Halostagnicola kamekurae]SFT09657.1 hypothetical protein SAMN04488556_0106 [Halostagnicola kamekurae]
MTATYKTNDNKPKQDLVNYSTVRVPELRLIYRTLEAAGGESINVSTLKDAIVPSDDNGSKDADHLGRCLKFLRAIDLLERPEDRMVSLLNKDVYPNLSFELRLLYHLNRQEHPQDHIVEAQRVAFEFASKTVERERLITEFNNEVEHINWNKTKINGWYHLLEGIGVLSYIDSRELVLSPRPALLYELLETFRDEENSTDFGAAVGWIEDKFLSVLTTRPGTPRLHQGVTDTLQTLMDEDYVDVRGMSDANNEVVLPSTHSRNEEPNVTKFELNDWPEEPPASKRYLLDRFTEVDA